MFVVTITVLGVHTLPLGPSTLTGELPALVPPPAVLLIIPLSLVTPDVGVGLFEMDCVGTEAGPLAFVPLLIVELATLVTGAKAIVSRMSSRLMVESRNYVPGAAGAGGPCSTAGSTKRKATKALS